MIYRRRDKGRYRDEKRKEREEREYANLGKRDEVREMLKSRSWLLQYHPYIAVCSIHCER